MPSCRRSATWRRRPGTSTPATALLATVGLLGADPNAQLAAARDRFEDGDLDAANRQAADLVRMVAGAADAGRIRLAVAGGGILLLDGAWLVVLRRRRQPRPARAAAV